MGHTNQIFYSKQKWETAHQNIQKLESDVLSKQGNILPVFMMSKTHWLFKLKHRQAFIRKLREKEMEYYILQVTTVCGGEELQLLASSSPDKRNSRAVPKVKEDSLNNLVNGITLS